MLAFFCEPNNGFETPQGLRFLGSPRLPCFSMVKIRPGGFVPIPSRTYMDRAAFRSELHEK
jgi:hypothetical protein